MSRDLIGMRIAILAADGVERIELEVPRGALYGAGALSDVLSLHGGEIQARQFDMIPAGTIPVDWVVGEARADAYDALLLPGGTVNPDQLRMNAETRSASSRCSPGPASPSPRSATARGPC